jgi:glycosyltransferase involved in cell wall biosynthesis
LGTGPYAKELCSLARDLGLDSRLKWLGFQADVRRFLSQADIFVLPSHREGLPNSLLEAMAEGLVPVARDVGGVREIWPQGLEDCLLSAEAGPEQWAQALESLLDLAPEKISAYKRLSWQTCQKEFALERQISKLESWLLDLIQPWTA